MDQYGEHLEKYLDFGHHVWKSMAKVTVQEKPYVRTLSSGFLVLGLIHSGDFRHEKTKKKRGSYRGGLIDLESHSIKFNYSDDE